MPCPLRASTKRTAGRVDSRNAAAMGVVIRLACLVGLAVSLYAWHVEGEIARARAAGFEYKAACDVGTFASCSKVLGSSYAHILSHWGVVPRGSPLDLSNAVAGALFYVAVAAMDAVPSLRPLQVGAAAGGLAFSAYLAYVLKFVLRDFCLVCAAMYCCNIAVAMATAWPALRRSPLPDAADKAKAS